MPDAFFVRDLMSDRIISVDPEASVAEALSRMDQHGIHELPVMTNSTLKGWISHRTLARHGGYPPQTKVASVMEQPPRIPKDAEVFDAAELMIRNNVRALPVVNGKGQVVGVLSRTDLLKAALQLPALAELTAEGVMNTDLETADENEPVDRAIHRLRQLQIGQLLVLDASGRLSGFASLERLVKANAAEHAPDSRDRTHARGPGAGDRQRPSVEVKAFIEEAPTVRPQARLSEVVRVMQERAQRFVAVVEDGYALGIISRSNVVERVARLKSAPGVLCQTTGLADHVDSGTLDAIYALAQQTLNKITPELRPQYLTLHYKIYKAKAEGDSKYSLSAHLGTERRFFVQKADAWDPVEATRTVMNLLEQRVLDFKDQRLEKRKGPPRRGDDLYTAARP